AHRAVPAAPVAERSLRRCWSCWRRCWCSSPSTAGSTGATRSGPISPRVPALPVNVTGGGHVELTDRLAVVQWLRCFLAAAVLAIGVIESDPGDVGVLVAAYVSLTVAVEVLCRRAPAAAQPVMSGLLPPDRPFLPPAL